MDGGSDILWQPSEDRLKRSQILRFCTHISSTLGIDFKNYAELYAWSLREPGAFWQTVADFCQVRWSQPATTSYIAPEHGMIGARWFPGGMLNFAENLLTGTGPEIAISSYAEGGPDRHISWHQLREAVGRCQRGLRRAGVERGDRVAGVLVNGPEAVIAMLATASLGAVWSSCSPDFGTGGVVDRLAQVRPKVLFYSQRYQYAGKRISLTQTIDDVSRELAPLGTEKVVGVDHMAGGPAWAAGGEWSEFCADGEGELEFVPMSFSDPLYILFSSGTTGIPKCIVHSVGGTLLQHKKELALHTDLASGDCLFYFTTCGWMMWNWMVSALSLQTRILVFDGAVHLPDMGLLWRLVDREKVTAFGTSPKFLAASAQAEVCPRDIADLSHLRTVLSTGSPLLPDQFRWVYDKVSSSVHLASISGGTDIVSCFMLGSPWLPVRAGEIQAPGLGMAIEAWNEQQQPVVGSKGELICTRPFPSMPVGFWNDEEGEKYRAAYFSYYQDREVWRHGDYIEITQAGGVIVYGRSDATLNPGGVRIGTAEIYRQVEMLPEVADSVAIGMRIEGDEHVVLFVKLAEPDHWSAELEQRIRSYIREQLTPRHVPRIIRPVLDIPYTRSGKKVELAVRQAVHGEDVQNLTALANPDAIAEYQQLGDILDER